MTEFDIVMRGGTVVDGSGDAPFKADVAVQNGVIVAIGRIDGVGREEIDATGRIVTPGFVDIHTHYDGQITWEHTLSPSSQHGVTTVVMGNCGVGFAPVRQTDHELVVKLMEGVEDIPEVVMTAGVPWNWETFPEYLDALDQRQADIDFATQLPHNPLRVYVMGERGVNLEAPTSQDLAEMRRLTAEAIRAGALGVSTTQSFAHRFLTGALAPSVPSELQEVLALAEGLRDADAGVFQMSPSYDIDADKRFDILRQVAVTSGRPVSFIFMQSDKQPGDWVKILEHLKNASSQGLRIKGQVIPRPTGGLLGLDLSLHPFALNPSYREIAHLPLEQKVARMRDPEYRAQIIAEQPDNPHDFFKYIISDLESLFVLGEPPQYHPAAEDSIAARARRAGLDPKEVIYDVLLERDGHEILYRPMANAFGDRYEGSGRNLMKHDETIIGLGDGGAHYSMICDAALPTYMLIHWSRDAEGERQLPLPWAIRKLTHETAAAVGLNDRGLLRVGYKADINVIDFERLYLHAPLPRYDLPAGGRRLTQHADGYDATIVSGVVTQRDGHPTGRLPGRLVRGGKETSQVAQY